MPTFRLPDPIVGGPGADGDPTETAQERFAGTQRNFAALERFVSELAQRFYWGEGDPENVVTAPVGSLFFRLDGGAATTLYIKETGSADTGWVGK
jgi:hypothetical protein